MEVETKANDAGGVSLPASTKSAMDIANAESLKETRNEQGMFVVQDQVPPASETNEAAAMPRENAPNSGTGNSKTYETTDSDEGIPAVTPPSIQDGVSPPVAPLADTVATDVDSPPAHSPETHARGTSADANDGAKDTQDSETEAVPSFLDDVDSGAAPSETPVRTKNILTMPATEQNVNTGNILASGAHDESLNDNVHYAAVEAMNEDSLQQEGSEIASAYKPVVAESLNGQPLPSGADASPSTVLPEGQPTNDTIEMSEGGAAQFSKSDETLAGQPRTDNAEANGNSTQHPGAGGQPAWMDGIFESQGDSNIEDYMMSDESMDGNSEDPFSDESEDDASQSVSPIASIEVIDLLDSDEEDASPVAKRQRTEGATLSAGAAAHQAVSAHMPTAQQSQSIPSPQRQRYLDAHSNPLYDPPTSGFVPTWQNLVPTTTTSSLPSQQGKRWKSFQLSLLNVSEFTITGMRVGDEYSGYMTSVSGLRSTIKKISKGHGNAFFERDPEGGGGKWHIPLGAYQAFYGYLKSQPFTTVDGISEDQLKIASLGKAMLEKDYPSARKLVKLGVPKQLANALAPFQRGGVDFVIEKEGRALIADEMGLGKTIQGIASMSVYHEEWPILILCPSSARYHWENEFRNWLGKESATSESEHTGAFDAEAKEKDADDEGDGVDNEPKPAMPLLDDSQIHVLNSGQNDIFPHQGTKVVICSYGLAPNLVTNQKIVPGMFKCAIVDESHMLKNKATQRTSKLLPILRETNRCVLLSGTPAFARPLELWPQLLILKTERHGWWVEESEFIRKYARGSSQRRAELHTMLMGTVMIRRMKNDILKTLPPKVRDRAIIDVMDASTRKEMQECMDTLRTGKGKLCELARGLPNAEETPDTGATTNDADGYQHDFTNGAAQAGQDRSEIAAAQLAAAAEQLRQQMEQRRAEGQDHIRRSVEAYQDQDPVMANIFSQQMHDRLEAQLRAQYQHDMQSITSAIAAGAASLPAGIGQNPPQSEPPSAKKAVLNYMYSLTGKCKIPIVVKMLKRWLADPTRGKLCIFAHHISVLDEIIAGAGLSNASGSTTKYIRIDGSTTPRAREEQINSFQRDSSIRIAVLGITAAGVAVTLTASSTVWFTELFWTPAIMVQAEDRVHRIGQASVCNCLYFVAKGTLDELLWKLLENKFQALGEFVEGKEKMKIVVNKTFHSSHELLKNVVPEVVESEDDDLSDVNSECSLSDVEELGSDLEHEIEELGLSEQKLLDAAADNDGSDLETQFETDSKLPAKVVAKDTVGTTEDDAICLSDDDEEELPVPPVNRNAEETVTDESTTISQGSDAKKPAFSFHTASFPRLRIYRLLFSGNTYGLMFSLVAGRMVVSGQNESRVREFGANAKPNVGDVLVAVNRRILPIVRELSQATGLLKSAMTQGTTELVFAEDSEIRSHVKEILAERASKETEEAQIRAAVTAAEQAAMSSQANGALQNGTHPVSNAPFASSDGVIEIE